MEVEGAGKAVEDQGCESPPANFHQGAGFATGIADIASLAEAD